MKPLIQHACHRIDSIRSSACVAAARLTGTSIGPGVHLGPRSEVGLGPAPARRGTVRIGRACRIEEGVLLHPWNGTITLGDGTFLGPRVVIYGHGGVDIGKDCLIAGHVCIASSNHQIPPLDVRIRSLPDVHKPVVIGDDVWIGFAAVVLGGVTLGNGCVIGAGAVVDKSLPPGSVAVGNPARIIRQRREHPSHPRDPALPPS